MNAPQYLPLAVTVLGGAALAMASLAFYLRARRLLAAAQEARDDAERTEASARAAELHAGGQLAQATGLRDEARRIEELLVRPRWALHLKTGRIRALLHDEEPEHLVEVEAQAADTNCRDCGGRGWAGRDRQTQRVVPCACVKRELHRARLAEQA